MWPPRAVSFMRLLGGAPPRVLAKSKDQPITVSDDELTLPVHPVLGPVENVGAAPTELLRQLVDACHVEVDIVCTIGATSATGWLFSAIEVQAHLVTVHNSKDSRPRGVMVHPLSIPIAGDLESENVPVILRGPSHVGHRELGDG
jgi:hypothetical protein